MRRRDEKDAYLRSHVNNYNFERTITYMSTIKNCQDCIWFDQCCENEACDNYEGASADEQVSMDVMEYEEDLRVRHNLYQRQIAEQGE